MEWTNSGSCPVSGFGIICHVEPTDFINYILWYYLSISFEDMRKMMKSCSDLKICS